MYLRHSKRTKNGKTHTYWRLVKSERVDGKVNSIFKLLALDMLRGTRIGALLEDPKLLRIVGTLAFISGASALSMLGSVFAHLESRTLWYGPFYPVYFLVSAVFSGYAFLVTTTIIVYRVRGEQLPPAVQALIFEMANVLAVLLTAGFVLTVYRLISGLFNPLGQEPFRLFLIGPFSPAFWIFEVVLMSLLPTVTLLWSTWRKHLWGVFAGASMVLIGAYVMRYDFVVAGQIYPNIPRGLPSYYPTLMEVFVIFGIFASFLLTYTLGETLLSLKESDFHQSNQYAENAEAAR